MLQMMTMTSLIWAELGGQSLRHMAEGAGAEKQRYRVNIQKGASGPGGVGPVSAAASSTTVESASTVAISPSLVGPTPSDSAACKLSIYHNSPLHWDVHNSRVLWLKLIFLVSFNSHQSAMYH